ncbi:MAG: DUF1801 domain-containing protein [Gammaproteobacteria bacterium]
MAEAKTKPTELKPKEFIGKIENDTRREDALALLELFKKITGWKATMWGPTIVGFGAYHYSYDSGRTGSVCATGFSPRKANLVIYAGSGPRTAALLKKLGKHKGGIDQCLYINKLADVDLSILENVIRVGLDQTKKTWLVTGN